MIAILSALLLFSLMFAEPAAMLWAYNTFVYSSTHLALSYWAFFGINFIAMLLQEYVPVSDLTALTNMATEDRDTFTLMRVGTKWVMFLLRWGFVFIVHLLIVTD